MKMKIKGGGTLALLMALGVATGAQAASDSWNVNVNSTWVTAGNWLGGQVPGSTTADNTDVATFAFSGLSSDRTVTVDNPRYIGGITFGNSTVSKYSLNSGFFRLNNGGVIQNVSTNGNHTDTINTFIQISGSSGATAFFTANAASPNSLLSIGAVIGNASAGNTTTLTLNGTNAGINIVTGVVSNGPSGGTLALVKDGSGSWALAGTNSFTGGTTVNAGTLIAKKAASLPNYNTTGTIAINGTAVLAVNMGLASPGEWSSTEIDNLLANANVTFASGTLFGIDTTVANFTHGNAITAKANMGFIKLGLKTLTLSGLNTYTGGTVVKAGFLAPALTNALPDYTTAGKVVINGGTLTAIMGDGTTTGWSPEQVDVLLLNATKTSGTLGIDTLNGDFAQWTPFTTTTFGSALGLTKVGPNKLILNQANTYAGPTTINNGTLSLSGGNNRLLSTGTLRFDGDPGSSATLEVAGISQTLSTLTFPGSAGSGSTITCNIAGSGTLTLGTTLSLGAPAIGSAIPTRVDVNMSGLSNFVYNASASTFKVGPSGGTAGGMNPSALNGIVTLAANNAITALNFNVNDVGSTGGGGNEILHLGASNTLNVVNVNIGTGQRNTASMDFAAPGSIAKIRGVTGGSSGVSTWTIGRLQDNGATRFWTNTVDFTSGTVDATVTNMIVALADTGTQNSRTGNVIGSFLMGAGTATFANLTIGRMTGTLTTALSALFNVIATVSVNGGTVTATTLALADNTIVDTTANSKTINSTFNLIAGTLNATTVKKGAQTGTATPTVAFNWTTGTIGNISGSDLLWTNVPLTLLTTASHTFNISGANVATLDATSPISGATFGITKAGTGTLKLCGANTYSGGTTISNGTLTAGCNNALASGSALILSGGTFDAGSYANTLGTLTLNDGAASQLLVNSGACTLAFTGMSGTGTLAVIGTLGETSVRFGASASALTPEQLSRIRINGKRSALTSLGYLKEDNGTLIQFL
jgi:autotransporter-associated beta strand protein